MNDVPARCLPFDEDLSALVDEELGSEREAEVREHLAGCARCAQRLEALCDVDLTLAGLPAPEVPGDLGARLAARIAADEQAAPARIADGGQVAGAAAPPRDRRPPPPRRSAFAARSARSLGWVAAAAALALAAWVALRSEPDVAPQAPLARTPAPTPVPSAPQPGDPEPIVALEEPPAPEAPLRAVQPEPAPAPAVALEAAPAPAPPAGEPPLQLADAGLPELADLEEADVALLLELDAVQDMEVIANLELLERFLALEERRGAG